MLKLPSYTVSYLLGLGHFSLIHCTNWSAAQQPEDKLKKESCAIFNFTLFVLTVIEKKTKLCFFVYSCLILFFLSGSPEKTPYHPVHLCLQYSYSNKFYELMLSTYWHAGPRNVVQD